MLEFSFFPLLLQTLILTASGFAFIRGHFLLLVVSGHLGTYVAYAKHGMKQLVPKLIGLF